MSQKKVWLPELGEIVLSKRRGSKNLRLSIAADGRIRVGMPTWVPYAAGISFAKSRSEWVNQHRETHKKHLLADKARIGKSYRLNYVFDDTVAKTRTRLAGQNINIYSNLTLNTSSVQAAAVKASEIALKLEASRLLPPRLQSLADKHGYSYSRVIIKKMVSRWGSCSSQKHITLNYFLTQLPWDLIDYVLVHELVHTKHLNHSPGFWAEFEKVYPQAKQTRQKMKQFRPVINSII